MRVIYITVSMPFGPRETFFIPEIKELLRQGHQLLIIPRSPRGEVVNRDAQGLQEHSVRLPLLSPVIAGHAVIELFLHPLASLFAFALLLRSRNLSTLLRNLAVFPKGLWLSRFARRWKADHIHAQWTLTTATIAMVAGQVSGIPWSCTAHRGDIADNNLLDVKTTRATFVRFISESGRRMAESLGARAARTKGVVIHMGVDLPQLPSTCETIPFPPVLLCPADLIRVKGHEYLLRALAILKNRGVDCRLDIAGLGELQGELERLTAELAIGDRVRFLGRVSHERILSMFQDRSVGVLVLPSIDLGQNLCEGIPVALMEAMTYAIPVVSTNTGGIPELLRAGAGVMVPPKDPQALANALERLIGDPDIGMQLAAAGRRRIESQFGVKNVVSELVRHLEEAGDSRDRLPAETSSETCILPG